MVRELYFELFEEYSINPRILKIKLSLSQCSISLIHRSHDPPLRFHHSLEGWLRSNFHEDDRSFFTTFHLSLK